MGCRAVRRCGMHEARTGLERDVPAADQRYVARLEGVLEQHQIKRSAQG